MASHSSAESQRPPTAGSRWVSTRTTVRWGDCDPAGIAFYPHFFEWMDQVSHLLAREMGVSADDMLAPSSIGFPLVGAQAEFLAPARLDDELEIRAWVTGLGRSSLELRHEIVRLGDSEVLLARGRETRVLVQRDGGGEMRARPLTARMRSTLERYAAPGGLSDRRDTAQT